MSGKQFAPKWSQHPGEFLAQVLEVRGLRQSELAERTGLSAKHVNQIIKKTIGISADVAFLLERALGVDADVWIRWDAGYQEFLSRTKATKDLETYLQWAGRFDRPTLERHHVVDAADTGPTLAEKILKFFGVATPEAFDQTWARPSVSFRRSQAFTIHEPNTALWLRLVERSASDLAVAAFNLRALRAVARTIPQLTTMSVANGFVAARAALAEAGVALTFVREISGTRVCAATWWLTGDRPAIGITERHRRPDIFWFTLLHEIGHIALHPRRSSHLDLDLETTGTPDPAEAQADAFASDLLFPGDVTERIRRARSQRDLILLAAQLGVGVPTVAGCYARLTENWRIVGKLRGSITDQDIRTLEAAVADAAT